MFNSNRNNPSSHRHYLSPLERLDQRTAKWKPNKVRENDGYKELCRKGECSPFQPPPSSYRYYHINRETSTDTLDDLTEYAQVTTEFSIDTEGQSRRPPQQPDPALIQIEFIQQDYPSLILLIETLHLPPQHSKRFEKIRELCQAIFTNNHKIYSWGPAKTELRKFFRFNLFDEHNMSRINVKDIQKKFKWLFHSAHPSSPYVKIKQTETYSLQMALFITCNQWLDKRMTLADWGCGIDMALGTYRQSNKEDELEIRQLMEAYAMNDCLAVTKIANEIRAWKSPTQPATNEQDETIADDEEGPMIELHPPRDEWSQFNEPNEPRLTQSSLGQSNQFNEESQVEQRIEIEQRPESSGRRMVHVVDEPSEDRHLKQALVFEQGLDHDEQQDRSDEEGESLMIHDEDEQTRVKDTARVYLDAKEVTTMDQKTRNRIANRRRRAKRYRFEVIRQIYPSFNITKVKRILKSINITYVNINIVRHTLFIGLKNKQLVDETEKLLHDRIFTEQHHRRLYPKNDKSN